MMKLLSLGFIIISAAINTVTAADFSRQVTHPELNGMTVFGYQGWYPIRFSNGTGTNFKWFSPPDVTPGPPNYPQSQGMVMFVALLQPTEAKFSRCSTNRRPTLRRWLRRRMPARHKFHTCKWSTCEILYELLYFCHRSPFSIHGQVQDWWDICAKIFRCCRAIKWVLSVILICKSTSMLNWVPLTQVRFSKQSERWPRNTANTSQWSTISAASQQIGIQISTTPFS